MDYGHAESDKRLKSLERRLAREYSAALQSSQKKLLKYLERFQQEDEKKRQLLERGTIKKSEYLEWRRRKMFVGKRKEDIVRVLAKDMSNTNKNAIDILNKMLIDTYALNVNYGTYEIESAFLMNTNFTLYDRHTVMNLLRKDPKIMPRAKLSIAKDQRWNRRKVSSAILQGILTGDSIPNIAARLQSVTNMNQTAAIRNARTYTTAAENKGRYDSYKRAKKMGINGEMQWSATHDDRTRTSHRYLDGEKVRIGGKFSNGLRYPGDPSGKPEEIYNCRCSLVFVDPLFEDTDVMPSDYPRGMSYEQWLEAKPKPKRRK